MPETVYEAGVRAGGRFAKDCRRQHRRGVGRDGQEHDLVELAIDGYLPDDLLVLIEERVPAQVRDEWLLGFREGLAAFKSGMHLGTGAN